jgi:glycosyltransferase involved in cell wall biosynthesis
VHNGLNYAYAPLPDPVKTEHLCEIAFRTGDSTVGEKLRAGFILHVGGNQWYKNRLGVIQIYTQLCRKTPNPPNLVMVGKPFTPEMRRSISKNHLETRVIELNSVSSENLRTLYCAAQLLLFPSFEEGFGWPIIEAQACGCRVVIADREPMTEIGRESAARFKLERATLSALEATVAVMRIILESREEKLRRVKDGIRNAARFSTNSMVEGYVELYRRVLGVAAETHLSAGKPLLAC